MGSIQQIYNPKDWKIILEGKSKIIPDDYIYQMEIGWCDDDVSYGIISIFISKENYENILNGKYFFEVFPYSDQELIIFDKDDNIIPLVKGINENKDIIKMKKNIKKHRN